MFNIQSLFDSTTLLWLTDSNGAFPDYKYGTMVAVANVGDQSFGNLVGTLVAVFTAYNVMMNVAKKKRSSFPESGLTFNKHLWLMWAGVLVDRGPSVFQGFFPVYFCKVRPLLYTFKVLKPFFILYLNLLEEDYDTTNMVSVGVILNSEFWKIPPNISKLVVKSEQAHHSCSSTTETS